MKKLLIVIAAVIVAMLIAIVICEAGGSSSPTSKAATNALRLIENGKRDIFNKWRVSCSIKKAERLARQQGCQEAAASFAAANIQIQSGHWASAYSLIRKGSLQAYNYELGITTYKNKD